MDGNFELQGVSKGILIVSFIGYETKEISFGDGKPLQIVLRENTEVLDEVVVVGYGAQKKVNLTGAVATLGANQIESKPITSTSQSLAGKIAGVHIAQSSGIAGSDGAQITIRGLGTLNNTSPLILVDGVMASSMDVVNPSDVESISVLKDAASAAIYGSQAANGVILVTTKKGGKDGKVSFNVNAGFSMSKITDQSKPKMVTDTEVFMTLMNEARVNSGLTPAFSESVMELYRTPVYRETCSTDWFDEIFKTSFTQEYNISAMGNSKKSKYYFSLGYMDQGSIVSDGGYKRVTARMNLDTEIRSNLKLGGMLGYTYGDQRTPNGSVNEVFALDIMRASPLNPAYNDDGSIALPDSESLTYTGQVQSGNPLAGLLYNEIHQTSNNIVGNAFLNWEVIPNLNIKGTINTNISLYDYDEWKGCPSTKNWRYKELIQQGIKMEDLTSSFYGFGNLKMTASRRYYLNPYIQMDYKKTFGQHDISVMAAASYETSSYKFFETSRGKYESNYVHILDAGDPTTKNNSSQLSNYAILSQFARLNYDYADKYLFEFNIRRDGSSRFGSNYKYGYFPSFSAGWVVTQEPFMKNVSIIDFLKLRASWGKLGNQNSSDNFPYIAKLTYDNGNYVWGKSVAAGIRPQTYGNPDIHWETTNITNIGFNLNLLNSDIVLEGDYFIRKTKDILYNTPLPYETGFTSVVSNLAQVENKGFELTATYHKRFKDFEFSIGGNTSYIKNRVVSINSELSGETDRQINGNNITIRNSPINSYYLLKWTGKIYQTQEEVDNSPHINGAAPGDLIFEDVSGPDGVPDGKIDAFDRQILGTEYPSWTFGANFFASYKGFSIAADFQGIADAYSYGSCEYYTPTFQGSNFGQFWTQRWTPEHPSQTVPRLWVDSGPNSEYGNTFFLMDRSYWRLKNLVVAYDLSKKVCQALKVDKLRVYVSASNLFTWTKDGYRGLDPERSNSAGERGGIPQAMTMKLGVDLTF
ncbi:TonB-dependent receptor [uncultured Bacteroides sp.]|uniref:SusC/RagA family TonB-linked outer membrane protein n=1 Tax=uncultured Bacteroides sp. TaxID=162156 RepID=UPI0025FF233F|nr:TonB-dependent receptor [uncultured Bacteroides sp.]